MSKVTLIWASLLFSLAVQSQEISISYIGNMGVIIGTKSKSIIIDGLHDYYKKDYLNPDSKTIAQLENGTYQDFPSAQFVLATHMHADHFSPRLVNEFLKSNSNCKFIGSSQLTTNITHQNQCLEFSYTDSLQSFSHEGISIDAFKVKHTGPIRHKAIQNTAYIIELNGIRILHIGDAEWSIAEPFFTQFENELENIDVAILPYWMLLSHSDEQKLQKFLSPQLTIATHISPLAIEDELQKVKETHPQSILFKKLNQTVIFQK